MTNILTTIPRAKFRTWEEAQAILRQCDGEAHGRRQPMFWLINTVNLPRKITLMDSVCYMVFDGFIRGYFNIVDTDQSENWRFKHRIGKPRTTQCIVMANWHPIRPIPKTGFQGWRYTELKP